MSQVKSKNMFTSTNFVSLQVNSTFYHLIFFLLIISKLYQQNKMECKKTLFRHIIKLIESSIEMTYKWNKVSLIIKLLIIK